MKNGFYYKNDRKKNLLSVLYNFYLLILGMGWVAFILYLRILIELRSYTYASLKEQLSFRHYIIFSSFVLVQIIIFIIAIVVLIKRKKNYETTSLFYRIGTLFSYVLEKIYWKPLEFVHDKVAPHIPGSGRFFLYLETKWKTKRFSYIVIGIFDVFPKLLVVFIFFTEAIFFQRITIYIYSIPLLIIPIGFSIFLKLFLSFATRNAPAIREPFVSIEGIGDPLRDEEGQIVDYPNYEFILKPEYINVINAQENINVLFQIGRIIDIVVFTKKSLSTISPYIIILTSSMYLIGGLYRLLYFLI